jgi:hypothetical protein
MTAITTYQIYQNGFKNEKNEIKQMFYLQQEDMFG